MFIVTAIAWMVWFRRAYRNLPELGAHDLRYKRGWAVGAWFVPFLNLWRSKQIANDIWRASDPSAPAHQDAAWHERPVPRLLAVWWLFWIVTSMLSNVAGRLIFDADTLEEHISSTNLMMWADGISALSAVPAILVVRRITRRQDDRIDHLSAGAPAGEHAYRALPLGEWIPPTAGSSGAGS
jgi:hypothetical protein